MRPLIPMFLLSLLIAGGAIAEPVHYAHQQRTEPRPLQIHILKIDLQDPTIEPVVLIPPDPDGDGPAEATLEKPLEIARAHNVQVAVNANAFGLVPPPPPDARPQWRTGAPAEIVGWGKSAEREASPPEFNYWSLWIDADRRVHVGNIREVAPATLAIAGFGGLLQNGQVVAGRDAILHPRTAAGTDASGRWLWLVVVDGRQNGYSEGLSTFELAELMQDLGCTDALNLDGGGSSVMITRNEQGNLVIVNRPSTWGTRPVPIMIGVRATR